MSENAENQNEEGGIPIHFRILPHTPSFYSNRTMLQRGELGEVIMTFFEIIHPMISDDSEEASERLRTIGVNAESQVRITLHPQKFKDFAELIFRWAKDLIPLPEQDKGE